MFGFSAASYSCHTREGTRHCKAGYWKDILIANPRQLQICFKQIACYQTHHCKLLSKFYISAFLCGSPFQT